MDLVYIKTDKNGTKYFHDWTCPRCGGAGFADKWIATGKTCWACGGTGKRVVAKVVKEYTPEYWEKLNAKRQAKAKKQAEEAARYAEEHAEEIAEQNRKIIEDRYAEFGCNKDGIGYVLRGKTYPIKDKIRKAGGRWIYGAWVSPVMISGDGIQIHQIDISGHIGAGSQMWLDDFDLWEAMNN